MNEKSIRSPDLDITKNGTSDKYANKTIIKHTIKILHPAFFRYMACQSNVSDAFVSCRSEISFLPLSKFCGLTRKGFMPLLFK